MKASTGYKVIMRFLYLLEKQDGQEMCLTKEDLAEKLMTHDPESDYGYSELSIPEKINPHLLYLLQLSLLEEIREENSVKVKLTELGRGFASQLEMPQAIEKAFAH